MINSSFVLQMCLVLPVHCIALTLYIISDIYLVSCCVFFVLRFKHIFLPPVCMQIPVPFYGTGVLHCRRGLSL